ncbi:MAG TPA: CapA family protein, partial [Cytophagaceae bacterium]
MVILSTILLFFSSLIGQPEGNNPVNPTDTSFSGANKESVKKPKKDTISIIGVGDIMIGTNYPSPKYLPPDDGKNLLAPVADILRDADVTFGNHEGTLMNDLGIPKKCQDTTKCYAFKSPEHYVNYLVDAGFDLISIANNHFGDFGEPGRQRTIKVLQDAGLKCAGSLTLPYTILEKDGVTYGLAAFAPNTGTCSINDHELAKKTVAHLDTLTDIVIVSFHGGAEGKNYQHVTRKTEMFYGENRGNVYQFAHDMIDAGADIIFGHGPHVTRA